MSEAASEQKYKSNTVLLCVQIFSTAHKLLVWVIELFKWAIKVDNVFTGGMGGSRYCQNASYMPGIQYFLH